MTVQDLIHDLKDLPPHLEVIMAKDAEGNGFSPCDGCGEPEWYYAETRVSGDIVSNEDGTADAIPAIVLWPKN